jgi:GAF domain-containing protein
MAVVSESRGAAALDRALAQIVERLAELVDADLVVARLADEQGTGLTARAVHASSASLRAELEGSRLGPDAIPVEERDEPTELPRSLLLAVEQLAPTAVLQLPVRDGSTVVGSLELMRRRGAFDERRRLLVRSAAAEVALARRAYGDGDGTQASAPDLLALVGDALAAGSDEARASDQVAARRRGRSKRCGRHRRRARR